ncbi:MAG: hypothetical protein ABIK53_01735 [bacterium]
MKTKKSTFALYFGNRGFFPATLLKGARSEMSAVLNKLGHKTLMLDANATRNGAVETVEEGKIFADFLQKNRGLFNGVILCLPNFGDETGAVTALKDAGVPILIHAYPDELDKMRPELRRDAFCGKFSIMDMFCQNNISFTALKPHTVHPQDKKFAANIDFFDRICRVVNGMKKLVVGAIGARTTAFKTVRIDELALQKHGISTETLDLSDIFARISSFKNTDKKIQAKAKRLERYCSWKGVPQKAFHIIVRLGVALDSVIEEYEMDAVAVRCWLEMQQQLGISPCVLLSEMNDRGMIAACEVDVGNAVTMYALSHASSDVAACLDWNNNYAEEENKCVLFHCGPVPQSMMRGKGKITDHAIIANAVGKGRAYGCNTGRIASGSMTFGSMLTDAGKLKFYFGQGRFTDDPIPNDFFGCAGVAEIEGLQNVLQKIGYMGHRHHVSVTPSHVLEPVKEAFEKYLSYEVSVV